MKSNKLLLNLLLAICIIMSTLFAFVPTSHAQSDHDWSEPLNLSMSGSAINPSLVVDNTGIIHAIWVDSVDKGYKYSQSADGITWTVPRSVEFPFDLTGLPPVLVADGNGSLHVFWISEDDDFFYGQATALFFSEPEKWETTLRLGRDVLNFNVILDGRGVLNVAFVQKSLTDAGPAGVYYRQANIGGGSWSKPVELYSSEYFKSAGKSEAYVRISTAQSEGDERIYVTWDNRAQKRIYMAISKDAGSTWGDAQQVKSPDNPGGIDMPFNLTVAATENGVLLLWQEGNPSSDACMVYSQWSQDGGSNWGDVIAVFGGFSECPLEAKIIDRTEDYISVLLIGQVNPEIIAWNGERWSDVQSQILLPPISNPLTFDSIMLGCRFDYFYQENLYVTGCDQSTGGDVWFLSRTLEPVENWFSPLPYWGAENVFSITAQGPKRISDFSSIADDAGNVHVMWTEFSLESAGLPENAIKYSRWDGKQWMNPDGVFTSLAYRPFQLSMTNDQLGRLLVTWIDSSTGDPVFSWANLENVGLSSGWGSVTRLPSPSNLTLSPSSIVDGSGRIVTIYAIPINDKRGLYIVQSTDNGSTWSMPIQVFDAVSAGWERIDGPRLSLGSDGVLHVIYIRRALWTGQPVGLYYSQSTDGGVNWSVPMILSEADIQWADIVSYGDKTVHVVWQEYDGLSYANLSRVSQDGGETWSKQKDVTGVNGDATLVALASDGRGLLVFVQLIRNSDSKINNQESLILQDWKWDGNEWIPDSPKNFIVKGKELNYSLSVNITSTGFLDVFVPVENIDSANKIKNDVLMFSRFFEDAGKGQRMQIGIIPAPNIEVPSDNIIFFQPTPTPDYSIIYDDNISTSPLQRNLTGMILIGVGVVVAIVLLWRRPGNKEK